MSRVSRRAMLAGAGALAATAPVLAMPTPAVGDDAHLIALWQSLLANYAEADEVRDRYNEAVLRLPKWAQWGGRTKIGVAISCPEWTDDMLREHAIPEEMGRRPGWQDIEKLNQRNLDATFPSIAELRENGKSLADWRELCDRRHELPEVIAVKEANARRKAAFDARRKEQEAEERRVGIDAFDDEFERLGDRREVILDGIGEAEAKTPVGATIKLRLYCASNIYEWGVRKREDADFYKGLLLSALDTLESLLPPEVAAQIPPLSLSHVDRPDALARPEGVEKGGAA
ncbi:hypothetical protein ACW7BJ_33240 [Azospirillum argentinense]